MALSSYFSPLVHQQETLSKDSTDPDEKDRLYTEASEVIDIGIGLSVASDTKIGSLYKENLNLLKFCNDQLPLDLILYLWNPGNHKPRAETEKCLKHLCSLQILRWDKASQCYFHGRNLNFTTDLNAETYYENMKRLFRHLVDFTTSSVSSSSPNYRIYLKNVLVCARHLVESSDPLVNAKCLQSLLPLGDLFVAFGLSSLWEEVLTLGAKQLDFRAQVVSGITLALATVYRDVGQFAKSLEKFQETVSYCDDVLSTESTWEFGHVTIDIDDVVSMETLEEGLTYSSSDEEATLVVDEPGHETAALKGLCPETSEIRSLEEALILSMRARLGAATVLLSTGQCEKASQLLRKVEESLERVTDASAMASLRVKVGQVKSAIFLHVGKASEALQTLQNVLSTQDEDSPSFIIIQSEVAVHTSESGESLSALKIFKNVLPKLKSILGKDHDFYLGTMHNKALAQKRIGENIQALHWLNQVIKARELVFGPEHPESIRTLISKAELLVDLDRLQDSRKVLDEVKDRIDQTELEVEKLRILNSLVLIQSKEEVVKVRKGHAKIKVSDNVEEPTGVLNLMLQVFNKSKEVFGSRHPFTLRAAHNAAVGYVIGGSFARAAMLYATVETLQTSILGPKNSEVSITAKNIKKCSKLACILGVITASKEGSKSSEDLKLSGLECLPVPGNQMSDLPFVF